MISKSQGAIISHYITKHPGCYCRDVINGTGISKPTVTSGISWLLKRQVIRREGFEKRYRYYATGLPAVSVKPKPKAEIIPGFEPRFGCANPFTARFNELIQQCRESRQTGRQLKSGGL